jgi:hypothetical protein
MFDFRQKKYIQSRLKPDNLNTKFQSSNININTQNRPFSKCNHQHDHLFNEHFKNPQNSFGNTPKEIEITIWTENREKKLVYFNCFLNQEHSFMKKFKNIVEPSADKYSKKIQEQLAKIRLNINKSLNGEIQCDLNFFTNESSEVEHENYDDHKRFKWVGGMEKNLFILNVFKHETSKRFCSFLRKKNGFDVKKLIKKDSLTSGMFILSNKYLN